ncbi:MAG: O-acetyl-ADP-ribose deacetylase [Peptoniphilus sp.]|nr:O-acetyl-ADP-ribose deacetylase [Peptoniphilus sp.]MDD7363424.1 O-acetyl-ADP-ribose deacetylase [Bacillota bacterium]MDY6044426.1 O-acetyl-ADP-ribose deacetylase [Peptoniphilus sp.]
MVHIETRLGDITTMNVDAIVNAANEELMCGGGVCGAIYRAAGAEKLRKACRAIGHCDTGDAVITDGFDLPADYIIHTVGPVWFGGERDEAKLLASSYRRSLEVAKEKGLKTVAFPSISTGIFGYPTESAAATAVAAVRDFLKDDEEMTVIWVLFDEQTKRIYDAALGEEA